MTDTIDALEAWWPPTLMPSWLGRSWLALSMMRVASHSTRCSISRSVAMSTEVSGAGEGGHDVAAHELHHL
jgi:hypothetical protein